MNSCCRRLSTPGIKSLISLALGWLVLAPLEATTVPFNLWNSGIVGRVVAVIDTDHAVTPVVYRWSKLKPGQIAYQVVTGTQEVLPGLEFPSILLDAPRAEFPTTNPQRPVYLSGEVLEQVDLSAKTWLYTAALGWVYVPNYPTIYSQSLGQWIWVAPEGTDSSLRYYKFKDQSWAYILVYPTAS